MREGPVLPRCPGVAPARPPHSAVKVTVKVRESGVHGRGIFTGRDVCRRADINHSRDYIKPAGEPCLGRAASPSPPPAGPEERKGGVGGCGGGGGHSQRRLVKVPIAQDLVCEVLALVERSL